MVKKSLVVMVSEWIVNSDDSVAGTSETVESQESLVLLGNKLVVTVSRDDSTKGTSGGVGEH